MVSEVTTRFGFFITIKTEISNMIRSIFVEHTYLANAHADNNLLISKHDATRNSHEQGPFIMNHIATHTNFNF